MRLSSFIGANLELILADWVAFARLQEPAASGMDERGLLDHGKLILEEIAADMQRPQNEDQQQAKSEGQGAASPSRNLPSRVHARERERQGFALEQMVAEYRALRATVLRLWIESSSGVEPEDLQDVIRFNEAIDQATAESLNVFLKEVEKTRDLFLGMLGHDLRGPLSTIASCAHVDQKTRLHDSPRAALVLRSVAQMQGLLDDLTEYTRSRLGAGLSVARAPLDLEKFARDTMGEIQAVSTGRLLALNALGDTAGEWDARRLHQALSNLVFNALKYGSRDKPVNVFVDGKASDEVILAVENSGKPIPVELMGSIFEPLVRAKDHGPDDDEQVSGANLGLGLYVVRQVALAHGGTVNVSSDDVVTRFELRLPRFGPVRAV